MLARGGIDVLPCRREDPLPGPLARRRGVLLAQGVRQLDATSVAAGQVSLMLGTNYIQMLVQRALQRCRQQCDTVLVALSFADDQLLSPEVDVLDPKAQALEQAQAAAVQKAGAQLLHAVHPSQDAGGLGPGQYDGDPFGALGVDEIPEPVEVSPEHVVIQEKHGRQRLVLRGGGDPFLGRQRAQETADLGLGHVIGMALAVEDDEAANPAHVGFLGTRAHVAHLDRRFHTIEQPWSGCHLLQWG
jgi:hypothetical protein